MKCFPQVLIGSALGTFSSCARGKLPSGVAPVASKSSYKGLLWKAVSRCVFDSHAQQPVDYIIYRPGSEVVVFSYVLYIVWGMVCTYGNARVFPGSSITFSFV